MFNCLGYLYIYIYNDIVDGRNPAPPWMVETLLKIFKNGINMDKPSINWCGISQPHPPYKIFHGIWTVPN